MNFIALVASVTALLFGPAAGVAAADAFPKKPVTIVAAYPPGGTVDLLARMLALKLGEEWKQTVVVENRPGASGIIGSQHVQKSPPDGYTLMVVPITHVTNSSLFKSVPYDPIEDFTPIGMLAASPLLLVTNQAFPAKDVRELVAQSRANPGKFNCGSGGNGTSQHLACELFKNITKLDIKHVPYKGNAAAMTDVQGGQIEMLFDQMATAVPHVRSGRVRALGVSSAKRSPALPDVPTIAEAGVAGYESTAWFGLVGPAGMPKALVQQLNGAARKVLAIPDVQKKLNDQGLELVPGTPEEFRQTLQAEMAKWATVIKQANIRID
ncbi:MAG TPA: tripartite tricarboxylate transporter substrate binding protein [Ramlibacter sp.]|uniref:tripartite tricarboxylate transporter substrate binding protein n=1 Tax=Ramlibacter sp. TaxID=1917967 RepID=UPI002D804378|nr:tripartite tricarboxylate transporter substrate binding protein [Ramlibacter sp.]HET8744462.1 tripartite tricarboxylate transporter substrate binding protein [Ramlibacter sp.]